MSYFIIITLSLILVYFLYPLWLWFLDDQICTESDNRNLDSISVIYLSQNGEQTIHEKIQFLLNEISSFKHYELVVIDDNSSDNSLFILNQFNNSHLKIIRNTATKGIPNSMNIGVQAAIYENIVFCDQRQSICSGALKKLIEPLKYKKIGLVSACISNLDKNKCFSLIRAHENYIKQKEAITGNLIGVYGPLYAIKKECYVEIPNGIILDDLYLTLNTLPKYQVIILKDCLIVDDCIDHLYNYERSKKYLTGLFQLFTRNLLSVLSIKQIVMLVWHKYLRLFIPLFFLISLILTGINYYDQFIFLIAFVSVTLLLLLALINDKFLNKFQVKSLLLISLFYTVAFFDLFIKKLFSYNSRHI